MKKILKEIRIYAAILVLIIPATIWACLLTIKEMMYSFPDDMYDFFNREL